MKEIGPAITTQLKKFNSMPLISPQFNIATMTTGYCVKCRSKREMQNAKAVTLKNGKPATKGTCPTCNTKMFRIGKA